MVTQIGPRDGPHLLVCDSFGDTVDWEGVYHSWVPVTMKTPRTIWKLSGEQWLRGPKVKKVTALLYR